MIFFLFVATRVLAFLAHPSHILLYAPGDSLRRRLRVTPKRLKIVFSFSGYGGIGCTCHTRTHLKNADAVLLFYCRNVQNPKRASETASGCVSK